MNTRRILILVVLTLLWGWFSTFLLLRGGVTLKNILVVAVSGLLIIYPMLRRYGYIK